MKLAPGYGGHWNDWVSAVRIGLCHWTIMRWVRVRKRKRLIPFSNFRRPNTPFPFTPFLGGAFFPACLKVLLEPSQDAGQVFLAQFGVAHPGEAVGAAGETHELYLLAQPFEHGEVGLALGDGTAGVSVAMQ